MSTGGRVGAPLRLVVPSRWVDKVILVIKLEGGKESLDGARLAGPFIGGMARTGTSAPPSARFSVDNRVQSSWGAEYENQDLVGCTTPDVIVRDPGGYQTVG